MLKFYIMKKETLKQKIQIVTIAKNQLLLLQFAEIYEAGFQNITGSVENGETFEAAATRELAEEIGVTASLIDLNQEFHFHDRWGHDVEEKVFLCWLEAIPTITLSAEHQAFKWLPVENITKNNFIFPSNFEAFQRALEFIRK